MKLLFATTNHGKLKEAAQLLSSQSLELLSVADFPQLADLVVTETGDSFEQNSFIKAKAYGDLAQELTVAEDAGLVIAALDGQPGVKSARFAPTAAARNQKLLQLLKNKADRSAKFVSVLCLYDPASQKTEYFRGEVEGKISLQTRGELGFDYDFIFIPTGQSQTFAELGPEAKNKISHRRQAIEKMKTLMLS